MWMERRARPPQVALPKIHTLQVQEGAGKARGAESKGLLALALVIVRPRVGNLSGNQRRGNRSRKMDARAMYGNDPWRLHSPR